jgi:hypothetical protein
MFTVSLFFLSLILTSFIPAYGAATLTYDNASGDGVWTNTENWTTGILPTGDDDVIITDDVDSNGGDTPTIRTLSVWGSSVINIPLVVTDGATFSENASLGSGQITGDVSFFGWSFTDGLVLGTSHFYDSSANFGTLSGTTTFHGSNINYGTIEGNAFFTGSSYNTSGGQVTGDATFSGTSYNDGEVAGDANFLFYTGVDGVMTITNDANFMGTGEVAGEVYDSVGILVSHWELRSWSVLKGYLSGEALFYDTSKKLWYSLGWWILLSDCWQ